MANGQRETLLETVFQIRPAEVPLTSLLFLDCLFVVGSFIVGRSARDALFLAHAAKDRLPLMYVASALAVAVVGFAYSRVADKIRRDHLAAGVAALFAVGYVGLRLALASRAGWPVSLAYVFVEVVGALTVIQFWTLANELFNARDARRLFGTIGAGGTIANIVFGSLVGALAHKAGTENLFLLSALLLLAVAAVALRLGRRMPVRLARGRPARSSRASASRVIASPHLKLVALLAALTFLATTLIDFQFKVIAARSFSKDALAAFFGNFYAITGALALFIQFFGTSRILSRFGVIAALGILPCFLGAGSLALLALPVLAAATFAKGSEYVFRYTVNDATTQLLYLPVAAAARASSKAFIDGVVKPAAIAVSGLLLLGYKAAFGQAPGPVALASAVACLLWGLTVFRLRGEYVRSLQDTLRRRRLDFESARHSIADGATAQVLGRALESKEPREVLSALELLPHTQNIDLDARVVRLLENESPEVRVAALNHLGRKGSLQHGNAVFRRFEDPVPTVRAAAIDAFCTVGRDKAVRSVRGFLTDPSPAVRAATIVSMIRHGGLDGVLSAAEALKALIVDPDPGMREHAARVLGAIGVRNFYQPVLDLMGDSSPSVRRAAIAAAGELKATELVTALVYRLAREETASDAVEALAGCGTGIEPTLERVLANRVEDPAIRRNVPRVLGRLGTPEAVAALSAHLTDPDEGVRRTLYKALGTSVRRHGRVAVDRKAVLRAVDHELERAYHAMAASEILDLAGPPGPTTPRAGPESARALLASALAEKAALCEERLFVLLGILHPEAELSTVYATFQDASDQDAARMRANAVELLDNVLERPLKQRIFPLVEPGPRDARLRAAALSFDVPRGDPAARLHELLVDENPWVRSCALYFAGERGEPAFGAAILESLEHSWSVVRESCVVALQKVMPLTELARAVAAHTVDDSDSVARRVRAILMADETAQAARR